MALIIAACTRTGPAEGPLGLFAKVRYGKGKALLKAFWRANNQARHDRMAQIVAVGKTYCA